jgi:hypothetical protein
MSDMSYQGKPAVRMPHLNVDDEEISCRYIVSVAKNDAELEVYAPWRSGSKAVPYGLWRLRDAMNKGSITIVQDPESAQTLWAAAIPSLAVSTQSKWRQEWTAQLQDVSKIYITSELECQIQKGWLSDASVLDQVHVLDLGQHNAPADLYAQNPEAFSETWSSAVERAVPYSEIAKREVQNKADEAWNNCQSLAMHADILDEFAADLRKEGIAGEEKTAKIIYLVVTSRLLDEPLSAVIKGVSSGGKSHVTEKTLEFFPKEACHTLTAMSDRVLAYTDESLSHRVIVLYEAAGLRSDIAMYLIRSLLSEKRVRYEVVEKVDGQFKTRVIEHKGPTGLILTTTKPQLDGELETRILTIPIDDTREQTQRILKVRAKRGKKRIDKARWFAFQEWLKTGSPYVIVPFAERLAGLIPPIHVRLRRDFGSLLNLIAAHALLHRASRETDDDGAIIATTEDYLKVRELIGGLLEEGIKKAIPYSTRRLIEELAAAKAEGIEESQEATLVERLGVNKSTISRWVTTAIDAGLVQNLEEVPGRPARLVVTPGSDLSAGILPTRKELESCTVAGDSEDSTPSPHALDDEEAAEL